MNSRITPIERPLVSIVVPVHNEAEYLERLWQAIDRLGLTKELLFVDDGSTDDSATVMRRLAANDPSIKLLSHERNRGKGAAVRTGFAASTGDIVVVQDADLEYDPIDLPALIEPIVLGHADAVYGSRMIGGRPQRAYMFWHLVGNRFLSLLTSMLYNTTISDMETGYKAVRGDVIRDIELCSDDFRIEPELTAKLCKRKLRIYELPIAYYGRTYDEGKEITWRDGFAAAGTLIKHRFSD